MNDSEFWSFISKSREGVSECEEQADKLSWLLSALPAAEILSFDELFAKKRKEAYRWNLWGAAYLINGGCSDDGFEYFRCWLISQGREVFENALKNPYSWRTLRGNRIGAEKKTKANESDSSHHKEYLPCPFPHFCRTF